MRNRISQRHPLVCKYHGIYEEEKCCDMLTTKIVAWLFSLKSVFVIFQQIKSFATLTFSITDSYNKIFYTQINNYYF